MVNLVELSDLGIENLSSHIEALLAKLLWHFFLESDVLGHKVTVSRHDPRLFGWVVPKGPTKTLGKLLPSVSPLFLFLLNVLLGTVRVLFLQLCHRSSKKLHYMASILPFPNPSSSLSLGF